jgi:hypothetical protein
MDKAKVTKNILSALEHELRIKLPIHPVKVDIEPDGKAVPEGELPSIAAKKLALQRAAAVPGVSGCRFACAWNLRNT